MKCFLIQKQMSTTYSPSFEKVCNSDLKGRNFVGTYTHIDEILQVKKVDPAKLP